MKCPRCKVEMEKGIAIDPKRKESERSVAPLGNINNDELELISVWKCPKCGYSDDGK